MELSEKASEKRVGASSAEEPAKEKLPMVVFLRGDEEIVPDFNLSAEDAMNILGIKRSRLTQISGKELRVGRIRVDRYVRPVFRAEDVENYLKWTRATASHKAASSALTDAGQRVLESMEERLLRGRDDTKKVVEESLDGIKRQIKDSFVRKKLEDMAARESFFALKETLTERMRVMQKRQHLAYEEQLECRKRIKQVSLDLEAVLLKLGYLSQNKKELDALVSQIQNSLTTLEAQTAPKEEEEKQEASFWQGGFHRGKRLRLLDYR